MFMLNRIYKYPIGVEVGEENVFGAQLKQTKQGLAVGGLFQGKVEGKPEEITEQGASLLPALQAISKHKRLVGKRVVAIFRPQDTLSFPIRFEVGKTETPEHAILRQSREHLPFPLAEAVIDYPSIAPLPSASSNSYRAFVIAVHRDLVQRYLHLFKRAGLSLEAVDFGLAALLRLHGYLFPPTEDPVILCHLGYDHSLLSVVTKDSILAHLNVSWGMAVLLRKIQAGLELFNDDEKAKILLKKYGLLYEDREICPGEMDSAHSSAVDDSCRAIYQIITPQVEKWIFDFHKITGYVRSEDHDTTFESIYLYGYAPLIFHLDRYLERRLNIPTKVVNPLSQVTLSDEGLLPDISEGGPFGLALGLGMRKVSWL